MKRIIGTLALCIVPTVVSAQGASPSASPTLVRVIEFAGVRGAAFDSSFAEFRAYLGTRPGFWTYSYYSGDNGHRYLSAAIPSLNDIARHDSTTDAFAAAMPNVAAFSARYSATWESLTQTIWKSIPALSGPPTGMTGPQVSARYPFRRSSIRYIRPGMEESFETALRDAKALDERLGVWMPAMVYRMEVGANGPAYLITTYAESQDSYWKLSEARRVKRAADPAWAAISRRIGEAQREAENVSLTRNPNLSYSP